MKRQACNTSISCCCCFFSPYIVRCLFVQTPEQNLWLRLASVFCCDDVNMLIVNTNLSSFVSTCLKKPCEGKRYLWHWLMVVGFHYEWLRLNFKVIYFFFFSLKNKYIIFPFSSRSPSFLSRFLTSILFRVVLESVFLSCFFHSLCHFLYYFSRLSLVFFTSSIFLIFKVYLTLIWLDIPWHINYY